MMKNEAVWQFVRIGWGHKFSHRCLIWSTLEVTGKIKPNEETLAETCLLFVFRAFWTSYVIICSFKMKTLLMSTVLYHGTVADTLKWCHLFQTGLSWCQVWHQITVEMISSSSSEAIANFQSRLLSVLIHVFNIPVNMQYSLMFQVFIHTLNSMDNNKHVVNFSFILKCGT